LIRDEFTKDVPFSISAVQLQLIDLMNFTENLFADLIPSDYYVRIFEPNSNQMSKSIILLAVIFFMSFNLVHSQDIEEARPAEKGFYVGAFLVGTSFQLDAPGLGDETDTGGGLGLEGGYNFNKNFGLFLSLDGSNMSPDEGEDYNLVHFDLGAEGRLGSSGSSFRPFARASLLGMAATIEDDGFEAEISGTGFGLGIGVYYFINSQLAFDLGYTHSWITIDELSIGSVSVEVDENATTGRLGLGFSYHF